MIYSYIIIKTIIMKIKINMKIVLINLHQTHLIIVLKKKERNDLIITFFLC
jgi:hypothetical protein